MDIIDLNHIKNLEMAYMSISGAAQQTRKDLGVLDDKLLSLRLNLGKLRASVEAAFAPITATVTPVLNSAVRGLTDFCDDAGSVIAALFGTVYKKAVTTTKAAGGAIRRTLASFDRLERLNGGSGGGSTSSSVKLEPVNDPLTPQLQGIVDTIRAVMEKLRSLLAPLKTIDFTGAAEAFRRLGSAVAGFGSMVLSGLETAWHTLLVPLAKWMVESAAPASVAVLTAALSALSAMLAPVKTGFAALQTALAPVARFLGETVMMAIRGVENQFSKLTEVFKGKSPEITGILHNLSEAFTALWGKAEPIFNGLRAFWQQVMDAMGSAAATLSGTVIDIFHGLTGFLAGVFTGEWSSAWEGLKGVLRGAVNGIIGLINSMLSGLAAGINAVAQSLNGISVTVPSWVPVLGGKHFGFQLKTITAPQIPYLAQGAVLPANKPFLAMVGDQRHGTNIEAPLSTIQEAVALAMEDMAAGNMAGHEATVSVLRQILEAVLGIQIGDEAIAAACDRSRSRAAVIRGV